jgi:spoIIIJ-associated protein
MRADGDEFTGKTLDDAIAAAERALEAHRSELTVEILTPGSRGVFGIGAEPARIRARRVNPPVTASQELVPESPDESTPDVAPTGSVTAPTGDQRRSVPSEAASPAPEHAAWTADDQFADEPTLHQATSPLAVREPTPAEKADLAAEGARVLDSLLTHMGFDAQVTVRSDEDPVVLAVTGENLGILIGRRGDNLSSLQFMVNLLLSRNRRQWPKVVIDVENYRARREESLRSLADRIAYRVNRQGRPFTLEAMPASDRRIIHISLRDRTDVETYSIGEGVSRRVVVAPIRSSPDA